MIFGRGYGKPGDDLTWKWLNSLLEMARKNRIKLGQNSGLSMIQGESGTLIWATGQSQTGQLAVVDSSGITARVTTTAGSGKVHPVSSTQAGALTVDTSTDIPVLNFSSTTGGILASTYVWITQDAGGNWFVTAVDCGN
jgi:hypothetical protein